MSSHLKAFVVVLVLSSIAILLSKHVFQRTASQKEFSNRRNLWFALTSIAFLSYNIWVCFFLSAIVLLIAQARDSNRVAIYFFSMFAIPAIAVDIPGFGIINYLFSLDHLRLLSIVVLLPAFVALSLDTKTSKFGSLLPDKLLIAFIAMNIFITIGIYSFTGTLRRTTLYFIDIVLPYYVASRSLRTTRDFQGALSAFIIPALILSLIGVFEAAKGWQLYRSLVETFGVGWDLMTSLRRGELLRGVASTGQAIVHGYVVSIGIGFYLYAQHHVKSRSLHLITASILALGLASSLSRGPWIGCLATLLVFAFLSRNPWQTISRYFLVGLGVFAAILVSPYGSSLIDYLPFVGTVEEGNITYRQYLLEVSASIFLQNPLFGSVYALYDPSLEELRQGQGIIDIVNTYIPIALSTGLFGLGLFLSTFAWVFLGIFRHLARASNEDDHRLGRAIFATLAGILVTVFTVSSISVIPYVYWATLGVGVAYLKYPRNAQENEMPKENA